MATPVEASSEVGATERGPMDGGELLGISPAIARLRAEIRTVATCGFRAVLVQGESGVGKEVVAEALRRASPRATGPYEVFDCPAVPEDHLESELFGTVRGAFPGAVDKRGVLERAHAGTVFFDEIAAMRREHQAKILRAIEGKSFRRVGGSAGVSVDVAVIAAAHEDLAALVASGGFRHDLYYRLVRDGVLVIPPLRDRREDVAVLVRHHLGVGNGHRPPRVEPAALERLAEYDWPGNVRQLHAVLRVALRLERDVLSLATVDDALRRFTRAARPAAESAAPLRRPLVTPHAPEEAAHGRSLPDFHAITASTQRRALLHAYELAAGNKTAAGVLLGFHRSPGEPEAPERPLTEARRNLALRKFRYWCDRLGIADALRRRPTAGSVHAAGSAPAHGAGDPDRL
jgi:DNA-binding NtrC family response regulator